ncbi:hypothetical protein [Microcoleus sp. AT3-D2]
MLAFDWLIGFEIVECRSAPSPFVAGGVERIEVLIDRVVESVRSL